MVWCGFNWAPAGIAISTQGAIAERILAELELKRIEKLEGVGASLRREGGWGGVGGGLEGGTLPRFKQRAPT